MRKVLLVSSAQKRLDHLAEGLGNFCIECRTASSNAHVWPQILEEHFDAIVIDASSSNVGYAPWLLCGELREAVRIPLLVLIRPGRNQDRLRAFRAGARQCLAVPVSPDEVSASLEMVLSPRPTSKGETESLRTYSDAWLSIDLANRRVCRGSLSCILTFKELLLLEHLLRDMGNVVPLETLSDAIWKQGEREKKRNRLKSYISRLRQKIEVDPTHPMYIVSQHGFGYAFMAQNLART